MRNLMLALCMLASVSVAVPAFADLPPPNTMGCDSKAAGDACKKDDGSDGTCVASTCTKLDYSDGSPPVPIEYDCLVCTSSSSSGGSSSSSSSSSSSGGSTSSSSSSSSGSDDNVDYDAGCSVRSGGIAGAVGAWALGAAILLLARRSRTRGSKRRS